MPFAAMAASVPLLLSLSLQGMALGERLQVNSWERLRRQEDLLTSAAHQLLAVLNGSHPCLLGLPLDLWAVAGGACATPEALAALRRMVVWSAPVRLHAWQPGPDGATAELELELELESGVGRTARRARFQARLDGVPPQAVDLRARELVGALP